jgi:glycosyltransferase involved in cell wall biosynthesis
MPAYNAAQWIGEAIESALAQTWDDFELVVSDDASTDSTLDIARSYADPRIRVEASRQHLGEARNHNRAIRLSTGRFVKFLHADDVLAPDCVEAMVCRALADERIGLVFSPREIRVESEVGEEGTTWSEQHSHLHERFDHLAENNDGHALFRQLVDAGVENWVGEPSAVLIARSALDGGRLFSGRVHQTLDLDLWLRIMLRHRVGFVSRPLCVYRHHNRSTTVTNRRMARAWLDRLWILEGLLREPSLRPDEREAVERLRRAALGRALRSQVGRIFRGQFDVELPAYFRYWALVLAGHAPTDAD